MRRRLGRVAVTVAPVETRGEFTTLARSRIQGDAQGFLSGLFYGGLQELGAAGSVSEPYAGGARIIAAALFALMGSAIGTTVGATNAVPAELTAEIEATIDRALATMKLGNTLAAAVVLESTRRPEGAEHAVALIAENGRPDCDTRVEVRVPVAGFLGGSGDDPAVHVYVEAEIRVVWAMDGSEAWRRRFHHLSIARPFRHWVADNAGLLALELERAQNVLAERIYDELFVVTEFPFDSGLWAFPGSAQFGCCWLRPLDPPQRLRSFTDFLFHLKELDPRTDLLLMDEVMSLQPVLRWESFPRPRDLTPANEAVLRRIDDVRYGLKVFEAPEGYPARLVRDLVGLRVPEVPLRPGLQHFWTIRARYRMDGKPQATRWAFSSVPTNSPGMPAGGSCDLETIPDANYYRFAAPFCTAATFNLTNGCSIAWPP